MSMQQTDQSASNRVRPLVAWRAMQELFKDKEDTGQVFKIIEALKGKSLEKTTNRVLRSERGQRLLKEKPSIVAILNDRDALRAMPEGSLGRAYLRFVETEDLSADGLMAASDEAPKGEYSTEDLMWVGERLRDTHDLYHVLSGYDRDGLGELCLLEYTLRHSYNRGIAFIVFMARRRDKKMMPHVDVPSCLREARQNGDAATWLVDQPWEELLPKPLEEVREALNINPPNVYDKTRPEFDLAIEKLTAEAEAEAAKHAA